jgi:hypothetical protein
MPELPDDAEPLFSHILLPAESAGKSTGPRTPEGKARSSQNARTHGCTSRTLILPGERQEDYDRLVADWLHDYAPQVATAYELVVQTAQAHWFYLRVLGQCDRAEQELAHQNPLEWADEEWKTRERLGRYRTTAERSFHRALTAIEARRKSRVAECAQEEAAQQRAARIELAHLARMEKTRLAEEKLRLQEAEKAARREERRLEREAKQARAEAKEAAKKEAGKTQPSVVAKKPKKEPFGVVEQWLEVTVTEGVTRTEYFPPNTELLDEIRKAREKGEAEPQMVYRRMNFPDGVPPEYGWANLHRQEQCEQTQAGAWCARCQVEERGGCGIQRMSYETWLEVIERETDTPGQHAGPTGVGNLPTPKERGGELSFAEMREKWVVKQEEK